MASKNTVMIGAGVVAVIAGIAWWRGRNSGGSFFTAIGSGLGSGAVDLVDGIVSGTVFTVGDSIGIPRTNQTECERAKAEGRTWDASFACPAGDFIRYLWD
jgi:hypothetical protein